MTGEPASEIEVEGRVIGPNHPPFIVAEMSCAHEGNVEKAKQIATGAAGAGVDAIQFELFEPDANVVPDTEIYEDLQRLYLKPEEWSELFEHARSEGLIVSTYAYDKPALDLGLNLGTDLVKLNSSDLLNPEMLQTLAHNGVPSLIGTGASTPHEISKALALYFTEGGSNVVLLHGVQNFPTDTSDAHISRVRLLREAFGTLVGYSDHTDADEDFAKIVDLVAVGMGADVIEKHITWDRSERGTDHEAALEPQEFDAFTDRVQRAFEAIGPRRFTPITESGREYRRFQKKAIVASKPLSAGTVLSPEDIQFLRSVQEPPISPIDVASVVGAKLVQGIQRFEPLTWEHVDR